jgi:hypothetical protein
MDAMRMLLEIERRKKWNRQFHHGSDWTEPQAQNRNSIRKARENENTKKTTMRIGRVVSLLLFRIFVPSRFRDSFFS